MNKSKFVWLLAIALSLVACSKQEDAEVIPPVVEDAGYAITGIVTDYQGIVLANAVITTPEGLSVKTDNSGVYFMTVPEPESEKIYSLTASYEGKKDVSKEVTIKKMPGGMIAHKDFRLPREHYVNFYGTSDVYINSDFINQNDSAERLVSAYIEGYENTEFRLEIFYYNEHFGADAETPDPTSGTFEKDKLFFATEVAFANGEGKDRDNILYTLFFNFDTETQQNVVIRSFSNGQWNNVPESQMVHEPHRLTVNNAGLGIVYAVFCPLTNITLTPRDTSLAFDPNDVDNTNGTAPVHVPFTEFHYKAGIEFSLPTSNQLQALLLEVIGRDFGLFKYSHIYRWNVNLTLPAGTGVSFSGNQEYTQIKYKKDSITAKANLFGDVTYGATTYDHLHIGGGN